MDYSICFLDEAGHTLRAEVTPFDGDASALSHAREVLSGHHMIEVWNGELLVARLLADKRDRSVR